jgi:hypothetical protein
MADRGAIALPAIRAGHVASAYCQRDWRVHLRSPLAIGGMLAGPLLLLLAIGIGLGSAIGGGAQHQILKVIVPGLVGMGVVLATSQRSIAVFSDRTSGLTDDRDAAGACRFRPRRDARTRRRARSLAGLPHRASGVRLRVRGDL